MTLKLWLIYQDINNGWNTYDSAVVVAPDQETARTIHPNRQEDWKYACPIWAYEPDQVGAVYIGEADPTLESGAVIIASFNAG